MSRDIIALNNALRKRKVEFTEPDRLEQVFGCMISQRYLHLMCNQKEQFDLRDGRVDERIPPQEADIDFTERVYLQIAFEEVLSYDKLLTYAEGGRQHFYLTKAMFLLWENKQERAADYFGECNYARCVDYVRSIFPAEFCQRLVSCVYKFFPLEDHSLQLVFAGRKPEADALVQQYLKLDVQERSRQAVASVKSEVCANLLYDEHGNIIPTLSQKEYKWFDFEAEERYQFYGDRVVAHMRHRKLNALLNI